MGHEMLARSARAHALRAIGLAWLALSLVLAGVFVLPHGWFDLFVPFEGWRVLPVAMVLAAVLLVALPVERIGATIVDDLRVESAPAGRLRNVAEELSIAIGEPADHVVVHEATIPNVGAFPTADGVVVMATTQAVEQLGRDELEALVAAQFAGMRDPWCRLATRAEPA